VGGAAFVYRTPTPGPSPQGGGECSEFAARLQLHVAAWLRAGACSGFLLSTLLLHPAHAQTPQTDRFELALCNISNVPGVFAALVHQREAQQWQVVGWYAVPDWGCVLIGSFLRGGVHVYAESRQGGAWKPVETDRSGRLECVDHRKWFYAVAGARECAPGQTRVRFRALQVAPDDARLTWSIGGGG